MDLKTIMGDGDDTKKTPQINMKGSTLMTRNTVMGFSHGLLETYTKVNTSMTREKEMER